MALTTTPRILGTAETRKRLPAILSEFRRRGADAAPVYIGSYRHADAVLIPAALAERIAPLIEDALLAERVRARLADPGVPVPGDEVVARLGLDGDALATERASLLAGLDPAG